MNAEEYCARGIGYKDKGQFEKAIVEFNEAIRIDPECFAAHDSLGMIYFVERKYVHAISHWGKCLKLRPEDDKIRNCFLSVDEELTKENRNMRIGFLVCIIGFIVWGISMRDFAAVLAGAIMGAFFGVGASSIWLTIKTVFTKAVDIIGMFLGPLAYIVVFFISPFLLMTVFIAPIVGIVRFFKRREANRQLAQNWVPTKK